MTITDEERAELRRLLEAAPKLYQRGRASDVEFIAAVEFYYAARKHFPALLAESDARAWNFDMDAAPVGERLLTFADNCRSDVIICWKRQWPDGDVEWIADDGRTTVTHHSFAPPTRWMPLPPPPNPADHEPAGTLEGES